MLLASVQWDRMEKPRLLLLNTTNHPVRVAYPYAFVQVSEVARRYGIEVARVDLFNVPVVQRADFLRRQLARVRPAMMGVTLRNTDSLLSTDYMRRQEDTDYAQPFQRNLLEQFTQGVPPYFPTHDTRDLIAELRALTEVPIVLGGFGFSAQPEILMPFLAPDFGVVGDAEPLFAHFDDVLARRNLSAVDNLCYFEGTALRVNPKVFHGPSPNREYVEEIIVDRSALFGALAKNLPATSRAVPIEVMRGCPYRCTFCSEPKVKGNRALFRDLDVVEDELAFLRGHGLNMVWFVCSEINAMGNEFALELAERVIRINEQRSEAERVRWFTYYLLRFSLEELRVLRRSGFYGGWNDIPAFDDKNLKALQVPYRSRHLVQSIKDVITLGKEEAQARAQVAPTLEQKIFFDPDHRATVLPDDMLTSPVLTLFLGNQLATAETVRETLRTMDAEGLSQEFDAAFVIRGERVFDFNQRGGDPTAPARSFMPASMGSGRERDGIDLVNPTFRFPRELVTRVGSVEALEQFFLYAEDTFLSRNHLFRKDWSWLLGQTWSAETLHGHLLNALSLGSDPTQMTTLAPVRAFLAYLVESPSIEKTRSLLFPAPGRKQLAGAAADVMIRAILGAHPANVGRVLDCLRIAHDGRAQIKLSEYRLSMHLYELFESNQALRAHVERALRVGASESGHGQNLEANSIEALALSDLLYRHNVNLRPEYRVFFVDETKPARRSVSTAPARRSSFPAPAF